MRTSRLPVLRNARTSWIPRPVSSSCPGIRSRHAGERAFLRVLSSHNNDSHGHVLPGGVEGEGGGGASTQEEGLVVVELRRRTSKHAWIAACARVHTVFPSSDRH